MNNEADCSTSRLLRYYHSGDTVSPRLTYFKRLHNGCLSDSAINFCRL